ncbi:MAG: succinyl-diaminopimelate desuccinylase [Gammaproteobacteria bacterium]|nr:succinyl-diaminopimelate desuccinylase [Gammaproteobacteria bacterium]
MSDLTLELTKQLISAQSVTPEDAGCQELIAERLRKYGFSIEEMNFSDENGKVKNIWARRGTTSPCFAFAGHTDVVPSGKLTHWDTNPFEPVIKDGMLYGRGAADMKTSLAAFVTSIERFIEKHPDHKGSIALLITSDEEGPATCGTVKVVETLEKRGEKIDYCLVGEPSSTNQMGDIIKNGRRGSVGCVMTLYGVQGHVAYPHLADNPIHHASDVITALKTIEWDQGNDYFPPTTFQISNINGGTGATNVIPGDVQIVFNLRHSTEIDYDSIVAKVNSTVEALDIKFDCKWTLNGLPFLTEKGQLVDACIKAIESELTITPELSTSGGTSDGRFIAPTGAQVVELGPVNATIHKVNECVDASVPNLLSKVYQSVLENLLRP